MRAVLVGLIGIACLSATPVRASSHHLSPGQRAWVKRFATIFKYEANATRAMHHVNLAPGHGNVTMPAVWAARADLHAAMKMVHGVSPYDDVLGRMLDALLNEYVDVEENFLLNYPGPQANTAYYQFFRDHQHMLRIEADVRRHGL